MTHNNNVSNRKVLITGGAGLIGSFVCKRFLELGYTPVVFDAYIQYISPFDSCYQEFLSYRFKGIRDRVIFHRGDTRDISELRAVIMLHRPEYIIHLAALPIADLSFDHPGEAISSIILGTTNVLSIIAEIDFCKRFVTASSSMVYGDFLEIPVKEDHPKSPKDVYGGTKLAAEIMAQAFGRRHGIPVTIVRPSAVYGPTDVNQRVSQIFLEGAMTGKKLILHGGGGNSLDFTYVEDIAEGFILATLEKKGEGEIFNITRGEGRSLQEFVDILKKHFPDIEVEMVPQKSHRSKRGALSIKKARDLLGFNPRYSLEEGLELYVSFMKNVTLRNMS